MERSSFTNNLYLYKKLKRKGRGVSFTMNNEYSDNETNLNTNTNTVFYQSGNPDDSRNRNRLDTDKMDMLELEVGYSEPITDSLKLSFETSFKTQRFRNGKTTFGSGVGVGGKTRR